MYTNEDAVAKLAANSGDNGFRFASDMSGGRESTRFTLEIYPGVRASDGSDLPVSLGDDAMSAAPEVTSDDVLPAEFDLDIDKQLFAGALAGLMSDDIDTRAMAAKTMSCIRHELSRRALVAQLARDTSVSVRAECVNALTKLEAKECLFAIERALDDSKAAVRLAAVRGVYRLAGEEGIDQLVRMLDDVNEDVRRRAATCLGWLGHKPVAAKLMPLLSDTHAFVRGAAVDALGNLGSSNAVSEIHELLSDPVESVRKRAHLALQTVIKMTATRNDSKQNETSNAGEQDSETDSVMVCLSSDAPSCVRPSRQVAPATLVRNMVA